MELLYNYSMYGMGRHLCEHFENASKDGMSAVLVKNEKEFKFLKMSDIIKEVKDGK